MNKYPKVIKNSLEVTFAGFDPQNFSLLSLHESGLMYCLISMSVIYLQCSDRINKHVYTDTHTHTHVRIIKTR